MGRNIKCVVSCPIDGYSGYSARSRDFVRALIHSRPEWDIKILSQRWGDTRRGYLDDNEEKEFSSRIIKQLEYKPDVWIQITIPSEFQAVGIYNIGVTAGIETTLAHHSWIAGCNRMNLVLVSSQHAKTIFEQSKYTVKDANGQVTDRVDLKTSVEVLFEGVDTSVYFPKESKLNLDIIPEKFAFLVVGHWLQGDFGEDRKNIGYTVKSFLETFKNTKNPPALLLKVMQANTSILDRERILHKIDVIRQTVKANNLPNIYLFHGEVSNSDMNDLYNHPKVKAMVSHTKGEGFGRPLLEFTTVNKPLIVSGWSGQLDFIKKDFNTVLGGILKNVHVSAVVKDIIMPESMWFSPDDSEVARAYKEVFSNYKHYLELAKRQGFVTRTNFTLIKMEELLSNILEGYVPVFPEEVKLVLPKLKKVE